MNLAPTEKLADSVPDTATRLGICQALVWRLIRENEIASIQVGRRRLITRTAQQEYIGRLETKPARRVQSA